ncbi:MAG: hypothetical protein ACRC5A_12505 [Enterobacteriaceae bacterium]
MQQSRLFWIPLFISLCFSLFLAITPASCFAATGNTLADRTTTDSSATEGDSSGEIRPEPPVISPPVTLINQLSLLLIEDQVAGNHFITTLGSHGGTQASAAAPSLFGARQTVGKNRLPVTWYPHFNLNDVEMIVQAEPATVFRGVTDGRGSEKEGVPVGVPLPSSEYGNLLLSESAINYFISMPTGGAQQLTLTERLQNGAERHLQSQVTKSASLLLRRPARLQCREQQVEGVSGKVCLLREVQAQFADNQSGDIQFILRSRMDNQGALFRVGQNWHPLGTSVPVAEFAQGKGIELFISSERMQQGMQTALQEISFDNLLEAGFYSASRHSRGDRFGIRFGSEGLPGGESAYQMARMDLLLIDDQVTGNQYITTLNNRSTVKGQKSLLYGARYPREREKPLAWYLRQGELETLPAGSLVPAELFTGDAETSTEGGKSACQSTKPVGKNCYPWRQETPCSGAMNEVQHNNPFC